MIFLLSDFLLFYMCGAKLAKLQQNKKGEIIMTKKEIIAKRVKQLGVAIGREKAVLQELESDKATLKQIASLVEKGTALEAESNYSSYDEWKDLLNKQIKRGETTLSNIVIKKAELEAFQFYLAQEN